MSISSPRLAKMPARMPSSVIAVSHWPRWATATLSLSAAAASAAPRLSATASRMALDSLISNLPDFGRALLTGCACRSNRRIGSNSQRRVKPLHRRPHAADAPGHGAHDIHREVRHLVDHEAEGARIDDGDLAI